MKFDKFQKTNQPAPVTRVQPRRKYFFENMGIGDTFYVGNRKVKSMSSYVSRTTKDLPGKYTVRFAWVKPHHELGFVMCEEGDFGAVKGVEVRRAE